MVRCLPLDKGTWEGDTQPRPRIVDISTIYSPGFNYFARKYLDVKINWMRLGRRLAKGAGVRGWLVDIVVDISVTDITRIWLDMRLGVGHTWQ